MENKFRSIAFVKKTASIAPIRSPDKAIINILFSGTLPIEPHQPIRKRLIGRQPTINPIQLMIQNCFNHVFMVTL
jgi:hypothetical protein